MFQYLSKIERLQMANNVSRFNGIDKIFNADPFLATRVAISIEQNLP